MKFLFVLAILVYAIAKCSAQNNCSKYKHEIKIPLYQIIHDNTLYLVNKCVKENLTQSVKTILSQNGVTGPKLLMQGEDEILIASK